MTDRLKALADAGVSIWLDDLSRERLETGNLAELMTEKHVVGVTTNPSIFAAALADGERYDVQLRELAAGHGDVTDSLVEETVFALTTTDVRDACDLFTEEFGRSGGYDGRVSIEVSPDLAHDTGATIHMAKELWAAVDRPNCLIKIPATTEGMPAITAALAEGISVNVTLIFGLDALPRGHGGLRLRARAGRRQRARPRLDPLGRVVLRVPRGHRGGQAARRHRRGRRPPSAVGSASPTPASPSRPSSRSSAATAGTASPRRAPTCSARCGPPPA